MRRYNLQVGETSFTIDVSELSAEEFTVVVEGETYEVSLTGDEDVASATISPQILPMRPGVSIAHREDRPVKPTAPPAVTGKPPAAIARPAPTAGPRQAAGKGVMRAPMPGLILEVQVQLGDRVTRGQSVAVLDAMKMKNALGAPIDGTVTEVAVQAGQQVAHGDLLMRISGPET